MDSCGLMYDFEGTYVGIYMSDFEKWLRERYKLKESRQLLSEFIVEQSLEYKPIIPVISSDANHYFNIAKSSSILLLCDFPSSSLHDSLHLDNWNFFLIDSSKIFGHLSVEELTANCVPSADYYMLDKLLQS